jgi:putative acetyltransferase
MNQHPSQTTAQIDIRVDKCLVHPQVRALLREPIAGMHTHLLPECVHSLDANGLRQPDIAFLTAWQIDSDDEGAGEDGDLEGELMACGALRELDPRHGEIQSMRTRARCRRQGAGAAILTELLAIARRRGYARVSLASGSGPAFEPALAMYRQFGFVGCGPFAQHRGHPLIRLMTLVL